VPRFAEEHKLIHRARCEAPEGPNREVFLDLLPEVYSGIHKFEELLKQQGIHDLPHIVTHGDFWASNIIIISDSEQAVSSLPHSEATVLDLDCYSFEPRITDFARAANWYYKERSESENAYLLKRLQEKARLSAEEIEVLPLMMCAHDLYYAVGHVFLFLEEGINGQRQMIAAIQREMRAAERYQRERDRILRMFLRDF
jgi:Ser/Thr protein kinase RdoA (MazF antagonist)